MTQKAMSEALSVSRNYIALIEMRQRNLSDKMIAQLIKLTKVHNPLLAEKIENELGQKNEDSEFEVDDNAFKMQVLKKLSSIEQLLKEIASKS